MTSFPIFGGCLCGSVRYIVNGPANCVIHCHCSMCRRSYASFVGTSAVIEKKQIEIEKGKATLAIYSDSPEGSRQFCKNCGCSLLFHFGGLPELVFYYPATLDGGLHPGHPDGSEHHIFVGSKTHWGPFGDNLPKHTDDMEPEAYERTRNEWAKIKSLIGGDNLSNDNST